MFIVFDVDSYPYIKERKRIIIRNYFWIDKQHQISGIF